MYDSPVGYPKGKKGFLDDFFFWIWLQRVKVFIWSFISGGRFSIILRISSGAAKDKPEDEDGSIIGYTHKGIYIYI